MLPGQKQGEQKTRDSVGVLSKVGSPLKMKPVHAGGKHASWHGHVD